MCVYYITVVQDNHSTHLFQASATTWKNEPGVAFDAFLNDYRFAGRRLRQSSFSIYRGMFARLREWAKEQGIELQAMQAPSIEQFLDRRILGPETRHRYLLFFTTLFEHLTIVHSVSNGTEYGGDNPARSLLMLKPAPSRSDPELLNEEQVQQFIVALPQDTKWKVIRDRALAMMVLGAGLRSAEVLALRITDVQCTDDVPDTVWVRARAPRTARKVPIQRWAATVIAEWLKLRALYASGNAPRNRVKEQRLVGDLLFPSGLAGGPLQPVSLFRLVKATLEAAGLEKRYEGPTLLRNSCGALWLRHHSPHEVRLWMGHENVRTTEMLLEPASRSHEGHANRQRSSKGRTTKFSAPSSSK